MDESFLEWYKDNTAYLEANDIPKHVAELIWDSAKASAMHDVVTMVNDGKLKVSFY